jgi:hypothetical protein
VPAVGCRNFWMAGSPLLNQLKLGKLVGAGSSSSPSRSSRVMRAETPSWYLFRSAQSPRYASCQIALCVGLHRPIQFDLFAGSGVLSGTGPRTVSWLIATSRCSSVFSKFRGFSSVRASNQPGLLCEARSSRDRSALLNPLKLRKPRRPNGRTRDPSRARARRCDKTLCSTTWGQVTRNSRRQDVAISKPVTVSAMASV